jgi:hypothetical protein
MNECIDSTMGRIHVCLLCCLLVTIRGLVGSFIFILTRKVAALVRVLSTFAVYECQYDERLKTKSEKSTRLVYTGLLGELEHLKIETRFTVVVYYESIKGEVKRRLIYEYRYDERLKT